jgi:hypothetical protein
MNRRVPGFTLLQLLVVMVILTVASALLVTLWPRARMSANRGNSGAALKQLVTHESIWRSQDTDGNGAADYWTRDVAAFHCIHDTRGKAVQYIDLAFARSDKAPALAYPELGGVVSSKQGYYHQAMRIDSNGRPYVDPSLAPPRAGNAPSGPCTNARGFGFVSFPGVYNADGVLMFMVNEDGVVWQKDAGAAAPPPLDRRQAAPERPASGWTQYGG